MISLKGPWEVDLESGAEDHEIGGESVGLPKFCNLQFLYCFFFLLSIWKTNVYIFEKNERGPVI